MFSCGRPCKFQINHERKHTIFKARIHDLENINDNGVQNVAKTSVVCTHSLLIKFGWRFVQGELVSGWLLSFNGLFQTSRFPKLTMHWNHYFSPHRQHRICWSQLILKTKMNKKEIKTIHWREYLPREFNARMATT